MDFLTMFLAVLAANAITILGVYAVRVGWRPKTPDDPGYWQGAVTFFVFGATIIGAVYFHIIE